MRLTAAIALIPAFVLGSSPTFAAPSGGSFPSGPYLQHLSSNSVDVRVELDPPGAATLDIETAEGPERNKRTLSSSQVFGGVTTLHVDGLVPETRYRYVVHAGALAALPGEFVSAPKDDSRAPFAFVVYGDTRSNDEAHAAVVTAIQKEAFELLVNTGDFVVAGGERPLWRQFFAIEKDLLRDHCVFACIGNHELAEDQAASNYLAYLGPNETGSTVAYGSFRWAGARFFLLNAFQEWGEGELSWLQRELDKADSEPNLAWRIVVVHHSPWSSGRHGNDAKMLEARVPELLVRHKVDLLLAGHDHIYERGESKGLKYVISGGGGAPLYTERRESETTRHFEAAFNFVRIAVDGDTMKTVARRVDGSTIEACGFVRGQSWDCDAKPPRAAAPASPRPASTEPPTPEKPRSSPCDCRMPGTSSNEDSVPMAGLSVLALGLMVTRGSRRREPRSPRA
jgi:predicted phosphodiesterase